MCEVAKGQRRVFRDQDPPRICKKGTDGLLKNGLEFSQSTPNSPTILQRAASLEKCFSEPEFFRKKERPDPTTQESTSCSSAPDSSKNAEERVSHGKSDLVEKPVTSEDFLKELFVKVPSSGRNTDAVITNGLKCDTDSCDNLTNGKKMAPVLGVPPPPPPAPHMGPDGLILPRKPYNPCLTSNNHKDLRRELLFNQKIGRNVLNQKSELQRALEKQREAASRREAEKHRDENFKDDPRTALQRAIEQRAKHIQMTLEQSQPMPEPPSNLLITARAKLRSRTDSQ